MPASLGQIHQYIPAPGLCNERSSLADLVVDRVTTEKISYMLGTSDGRRAAPEQRRAERAAETSARKQHRHDLKAFVQTHKPARIAEFNDVRLFPDRIIRLPGLASMNSLTNWTAEPDVFQVAGVQAAVERISGRSTLARRATSASRSSLRLAAGGVAWLGVPVSG
jgi:hypothetical protein